VAIDSAGTDFDWRYGCEEVAAVTNGGSSDVAFTSIGIEMTQLVHISNRCGSISISGRACPAFSVCSNLVRAAVRLE